MQTNTKEGALVATWLYILGHLAAIDQIVQTLAFAGAAITSGLTVVDWITKKRKKE